MRADLLPGEIERYRLRPSPWSYSAAFLRALAFAAYGALLGVLFATSWWQGVEAGPWYKFWTYLYGNAAMGHILMLLGLIGGSMLFGVAMRRHWLPAGLVGTGVGAAVTTMSLIIGAEHYDVVLPSLLGGATIGAILVIEADRRMRAIVLTNVRCVVRGGLFDREERMIRYQDVADIDIRRSPLGMALQFGDLIPVLQPHAKEDAAPPIVGLRPIEAGRELLAAMVQEATSSKDLQRAGKVDQHMQHALDALRVKTL